jgi:hypothetical protein
VVRLTGPRLVLLVLAVLLLAALAGWTGFQLGRVSPTVRTGVVSGADHPEVRVEDGGKEGAAGFGNTVELTAGFALLVFRSASLEETEAIRSDLAERGFAVRLDQDPRRPREDRFRVLVGPYPDRPAAEAARRRLGSPPTQGEPELVWIE